MLSYIQFLNLPERVALALVAAFLVAQLIGELLELMGKVVPTFFKVRKYFLQKKAERDEQINTLKEVRQLLNDVNLHYSADNIAKRDGWMQWVNDRATVYDESISEITKNMTDVAAALKDNTKMTEKMFIQSSRDRIIDFATKVGNENAIVSREEFNRIFKVYDEYEAFLEERGLTNGEIDIVYRIIRDSYEAHTRNRSFIEDIRGYNND